MTAPSGARLPRKIASPPSGETPEGYVEGATLFDAPAPTGQGGATEHRRGDDEGDVLGEVDLVGEVVEHAEEAVAAGDVADDHHHRHAIQQRLADACGALGAGCFQLGVPAATPIARLPVSMTVERPVSW